mgnify:FL=1
MQLVLECSKIFINLSVTGKAMQQHGRLFQALFLISGMTAAMAHAEMPVTSPDALQAVERNMQEYRERRLERALRDGTVTPEEAERLRRHWRESAAVSPLERLRPEDREQLRQFAEQRRRDRIQLLESLSPEQREMWQRKVRENGFDRQQLLDILTPEQRQLFLQKELQRRESRERYLRELDARLQHPPRRATVTLPE